MARIEFNFLAGSFVMCFLLGFLFLVNGEKAVGSR